ncbi:DUF4382 domain-containing protein [Chitinophaga sp. ARDCPP14]|uniref:DUF4382 domain-containing protein n=1 Tax=Chitinophaga sp. ARDCPP14 TaxID=3391139 RepID=UPI003F527FA2
MKNQFFATLMVVSASMLFFSACSKDESTSNSGKSKLTVYLTDDPAIYDEVNIDIQDIQVNASADAAETGAGWVSVPLARPGVYNLLDFRNGLDTLLASKELPAGKISQIRLILGANNSVVLNGVSHPLETPSAQQSGLKLNVHADLVADIEYRLWIDFDAGRSIVTTGSNKYILKPVIRTYTAATSGTIKGIALPLLQVKGVYAIQNTDTVASALPDALTGAYVISGLSAGTYNVAIAGNGILKDTTVAAVAVKTGEVSTVSTITLK